MVARVFNNRADVCVCVCTNVDAHIYSVCPDYFIALFHCTWIIFVQYIFDDLNH